MFIIWLASSFATYTQWLVCPFWMTGGLIGYCNFTKIVFNNTNITATLTSANSTYYAGVFGETDNSSIISNTSVISVTFGGDASLMKMGFIGYVLGTTVNVANWTCTAVINMGTHVGLIARIEENFTTFTNVSLAGTENISSTTKYNVGGLSGYVYNKATITISTLNVSMNFVAGAYQTGLIGFMSYNCTVTMLAL